MTTIKEALEAFMSEQERLLKPRAYEEYEEVVYLFEWYLHGFAYVHLNEEDGKYYDELFYKKGYCESFGTEYIRATEMKSFLVDFITRKGPGSKTFMKIVGRVMPEMINWLHEKSYMEDKSIIKLVLLLRNSKTASEPTNLSRPGFASRVSLREHEVLFAALKRIEL